MNKICTGKCGLEKNISEFHLRKDSPDGHRHDCKDCVRKRQQKYNNINAEKRKNWMIEYNNQIVEICCVKCHAQLKVTLSVIIKGTNYCPNCQNDKIIFEEFCKILLERRNIEYLREKSLGCIVFGQTRHFDFYLPKYNLIIEIDEDGHRNDKKIIEIDKLKDEFCLNKGINIFRIPCYHRKKITSYKNIIKSCQILLQ